MATVILCPGIVEVELGPKPPRPPHSTPTRWAVSYTMVASCRPGGDPTGRSCAQWVPSQVHVSFISVACGPLNPPNSTLFPTAASYASTVQARGGGLTPGEACDQFAPSHVHVSP